MSALRDIDAALKLCPPVGPGVERVILVGKSARYSILSAIAQEEASASVLKRFAGLDVIETSEFEGWDIQERKGPRGRWRSVERKAA